MAETANNRITFKILPGITVDRDISERDVQKKISDLVSKIKSVVLENEKGMSNYVDSTTGKDITKGHKATERDSEGTVRTIDTMTDNETKKLTHFGLKTINSRGIQIEYAVDFASNRNGNSVTFGLPGVADFSALRPKGKLDRLDLFKKELDSIN